MIDESVVVANNVLDKSREIRNNIAMLLEYAEQIGKCNSFSDFAKIFWNKSEISDKLKGAVGENFFDELCLKYPGITQMSTDFRPSTPDEDYYSGVDAIGETQKSINGSQQPAIRQDKAYNPFNPNAKLCWDDVSRAAKTVIRGEIEGKYICICTFLHADQITDEVKTEFKWIVSRDNFEKGLDKNNEFFKKFSARIVLDNSNIKNKHSRLIGNFKESPNRYKLMSYQEEAIAQLKKHTHNFIQLPPGSGKTDIQQRCAEYYFIDGNTVVYIAPTLDLLDQNAYKMAIYLKAVGIDFNIIAICSRKGFTLNSGKASFVSDDNMICGNIGDAEVQNRLTAPGKKLIITTYASYPTVADFYKEKEEKFDRISDEVLSAVPGSIEIKDGKEVENENKRWYSFSDMSIINRSANFDAFEKVSNLPSGPGTQNKSVFGHKYSKSFKEMIDIGTIVPLQVRILYVKASENKDYHLSNWLDEDKINFNGICKAIDDLCNDKTITNKKMIAFLHSAAICEPFKEPLARYVAGRITSVEYIIAETDTKDRQRILQNYKAAKDAIILNFGVLGKGIDDSTTSAVFLGRSMISTYGLHGIHRGNRSDKSEFGLPPDKHEKKPYGIAYIMVVENNEESVRDFKDFDETIKLLLSTGWVDNVRSVNPPKPKPPNGNTIDNPPPVNISSEDTEDTELLDRALLDRIVVIKQVYEKEKEKSVNNEKQTKFDSMTLDELCDSFANLTF